MQEWKCPPITEHVASHEAVRWTGMSESGSKAQNKYVINAVKYVQHVY